jgi:citrate synthase
MMFFLIRERMPTPAEVMVLDACLVTLMEHGLNASTIIARLLDDSGPGQVQVAMAGGLLAVGDVFVGTMDGAARILAKGVLAEDSAAFCRDTVADHIARKAALPGFGHRKHRPDDPRPARLFAVAAEAGVEGRFIALLQQLGVELDRVMGRHVTINATGAIAALLLEIGMPLEIMRAVAVAARAGGLPGHLLEGRRTRSGRRIWELVEEAVPYEPPG